MEKFKKYYDTIIWIIILPVFLFMLKSVKTADFFNPVVLLISSLIIYFIFINPRLSIFILPFLSYLLPESFRVFNQSPGFLLAILTIIVIGLYFTTFKIEFRTNIFWIIVFLFLLINYLVGSAHLMNFFQGVIPFFIFSVLIKNEKLGRLVLKYWTIAFAFFSVSHIIKSLGTVKSGSILMAVANIRNIELSGHNPNVIGWTALLFLPISLAFVMTSKEQKEKLFWWLIFLTINLMIIFTFSRAAMAGMFLTFLLTIIFFKNRGIVFSIMPFIMICGALYFIWSAAVRIGVMDAGRALSISGLSPEFFKRFDMIKTGFMIATNINENSVAKDALGFHSTYIKAWVENGFGYLCLIIFLFFYIIKTTYSISYSSKNENIRLISISLLIAFIVAAFQALFGITLFSAKYLQVFWILIGYLYLLNSHEKSRYLY